MKVTYTYDIGWKKLMLTGDNLKKISPQFYKNILLETADVAANEWWRLVHVITGRTKNSIGVTLPSSNQITVFGAYGAYWEEKKGGQHAGLQRAMNKARREFLGIANAYMTDTIESAIQGRTRPSKSPRYIRKWRNAQTGELRYEYMQTGYMGGSPRRVGGRRTQAPIS